MNINWDNIPIIQTSGVKKLLTTIDIRTPTSCIIIQLHICFSYKLHKINKHILVTLNPWIYIYIK